MANSKIMPLSAFGTALDNAAASDTNSTLQVSDLPHGSVPACFHLTPHGRDAHYSNVGNQEASTPDRPRSRRVFDPDILVVSCRSIAPRTDGTISSTTPHGESSQRDFRVTHPFHPLFGQRFRLV